MTQIRIFGTNSVGQINQKQSLRQQLAFDDNSVSIDLSGFEEFLVGGAKL